MNALKIKTTNQLLVELEKNGCKVITKSRGVMVTPPNGVQGDSYMVRHQGTREGRKGAFHPLRRSANKLNIMSNKVL